MFCTAGYAAYHQVEGLPMGANYAVLVANLTCFYYDIYFLSCRIKALSALKTKIRLIGSLLSVQRSAPVAKLDVLHDLIFTAAVSRRYTDSCLDCLRGRTRVSGYICDDQLHRGTDGIYPGDVLTFSGIAVALPLEIETVCSAGQSVHFLNY